MLPPPVDFGLPEQYIEWRPGQAEAVIRAMDSPNRMLGAVLPTGFGKSLMYMATAHLTRAKTVILTSTKALQRQLMRDFKVLDTCLIQGQRAYICEAMQPSGKLYGLYKGERFMVTMVDHGPCHLGVECELKLGGCGYFDAVRSALRVDIVITNYAWWFTLVENLSIRLQPDLLICDEAHDAPDALAGALGADVMREDVYDILGQKLGPAAAQTPAEWVSWARLSVNKLTRMLEGTTPQTREAAQKLRRAQWLLRSLKRVTVIEPPLLLASDAERGIRFDVVWAAPYAEQYLFRSVPKIVLTSATFSMHTAELLGVVPNDIDFYEAGDGFPTARRPVYVLRTPEPLMPIRVDHSMSADLERRWLDRIDDIVASRSDRKGIIHCHSYKRRDAILARSRLRDGGQLMSHGRHDTADRIRAFKASKPGTVFVSPSITTGYDFPYDECEYQIIAKIPFPDSRDPVVAARTLIDRKYPAHVAMQKLVQAVGRGMRAEDDACETFIVDEHSRWFLSKHADLAPRWFRKAIKRTESLPAPPPLVGRQAHHAGDDEETD